MKKINKAMLKAVIKQTAPVFAGYIFLGIAFGLLVRTKGFPVWYPVIMSIVIFSGALEFAAIPLLSQPFDPLGTFILGVMISARHLFYGIPLLGKYKDAGVKKPFLIYWLSDETFSICSTVDAPEGLDSKTYYFLISLFDYSYWNIGTLIGALFGNVVGDKAQGLDFALTALFIVLFVEQLKDKRGIISGFTGLLATAVILMLVGSGKMVIVSMIVIVVVLLAGRKVIDRE